MTSNRWEEINRIYDAAVEVEERERSSFLEKACGEDAELRREVESLLAYDKQAQPLLDRPALQVTAEKLASEPPSLVGQKLGPYQILAVLGAGGMGEVYTARDTRLNRTVAIKVLPRHLSERPDRRQRLEREARAVASLNHPHICALYDVGKEGETDFLVMEYLEGETLSARLRRGPLATEEVLRYCQEIAGALDKAHRKAVIHRDLKPGNIMLTETGAKLLDFGLAKQAGGAGAPRTLSNAGGSARSTKSESLTEEGMLLGTLGYMAPEQLEGKEADTRTDIFALGVVIYEMATGRKAFEGDSKASVIAKILTAQPPPITTIQPVSPPELDHVVQRCLVKKPEERWQSVAEVNSALQEIAEAALLAMKAQKRAKDPSRDPKEIEPRVEPTVPLAAISESRRLSRLLRFRAWKLSFIGILLALTIGSLVVWRVWQQPETRPKEISFKPLTSYSTDNPLESAAVSADGKYLAFCSKGKLSIQVMRSGEKRSVKLPEGFYASAISWFPDGTKLLLSRPETGWTQVNGQTVPESENSLWSLSILGGTPQKIVDHALFPSISLDGTLVAFSRFNPELRNVNNWVVGSNGEGQRRIRDLSRNDESYFAPVWLRNGERIFYIRDDGHAHWIESCDVHGKQITSIYPSKSGLEYSATWEGIQGYCWARDGRILFSLKEKDRQPSSLWEIKVDPTTGRPLGPARRITEWSNFGILHAEDLSITADGKQLVTLRTTGQTDVYVADLESGGKAMKNPKRLTFAENDDAAWDWTADSRVVLFMSLRNGNWDIFKQDIKQQDIEQAQAEPIAATPQRETYPSFSPDGAFFLYKVSQEPGPYATRLMRVPVSGGPPELVLSGENIKNFSCAREAKLCVVAEEVEGKQVLSTFDPLKGRGERLPLSDLPELAYGILSPQGKLIDKIKPGPDGLYIRVRSLTGGPVKEVTFKNLVGSYNFKSWSVDGKGIYIDKLLRTDFESLYAGLDGTSQVLWKRGTSPGWWLDHPVPSPDGRHLAFTLGTRESNAWVLENF